MASAEARFKPVTKSFALSARPSPSVSSRIVILSAPRGPLRGRLGHAVVLGAQIPIDLDRLQPGRGRILQILNDPHPAAIVERHRHRLAHLGLAGEQLDGETLGHLEMALGLERRKRRAARQRLGRDDGLCGQWAGTPNTMTNSSATNAPLYEGELAEPAALRWFRASAQQELASQFGPRGHRIAARAVDARIERSRSRSISASSKRPTGRPRPGRVTSLRINSGISDFCCGTRASISSLATRTSWLFTSLSTTWSAVRSTRNPAYTWPLLVSSK